MAGSLLAEAFRTRMAGSPDVIRIAIHRSRESCSESTLGPSLDSNRDSRDRLGKTGCGEWGDAIGPGTPSTACSSSRDPISDCREPAVLVRNVSGDRFWFRPQLTIPHSLEVFPPGRFR